MTWAPGHPQAFSKVLYRGASNRPKAWIASLRHAGGMLLLFWHFGPGRF